MLALATYAVESLLNALLMPQEERAELEKKRRGAFMRWAGENGIRAGRYNANGKFEMMGEVVPFKTGDALVEGEETP